MAAFMGLFRRWLDPTSDEDNNQTQPTSSDGPSDDEKRSDIMLSYQLKSEDLQREFQMEIERLQAELNSAREEINAMQRRHADALGTKEAGYQRRLNELRTQIDALNNHWMMEKRKSEQLEKTTEDQNTRQQQQLQMQRESNARLQKELKDKIAKQERTIKDKRTETLRVRNEYQRDLDAKEADRLRLNQQLNEVSKRLEDEVKVSVAEKKRREMAETKLEYQTKKQADLDVRYNDTLKQLNVVKETLSKRMKEKTEEQTKFDSMEKHYKETLTRKESDYLKLQQRLTDLNSTLKYQTKQMNSERRTNEILEKEIKEIKERELQLINQHQQQLHELQLSVHQRVKELENERRRTTDIKKQRDEALTANEFNGQKFHKEFTDIKKKFENQTKALQGEKQAREAIQMQLQEQKKSECQKDSALESEKQARQALEMHLQEQNKIECQKNRVLESEKQKREALEIQLREQMKIENQKSDQLQHSINRLATNGEQILFLTKELETERQKNVSLEKDRQELTRKANSDCQSLQATITELQTRLENEAKNLLMEKQRSADVEKQFRWQSDALKYQECQLGLTRKELDELKEMFAKTEIEMSNERLQNAYMDIDRRTLFAVKEDKCKEVERQLTEMRGKFESQTELFSIETQKRIAVNQELQEGKKRQLEIEEQHKKQLMELEERLERLQRPGSKKNTEGGPEIASAAVDRDESSEDATRRSQREDAVVENQKLSMELSVVREKLKRGKEKLERERQTRIAFQEQSKLLIVERDAQMEKAAKETDELVNCIRELEAEKRSRIENSDNQSGRQSKRDDAQLKESTIAGPDENSHNQVTEEQDNETMSIRSLDNEAQKVETMETHLASEATLTQLDEQTKKISELSEALNEEKQKNLKLMIQRRYARSHRDKVLQQLQFVQQNLRLQLPLKRKLELEALSNIRESGMEEEDQKRTSTKSQEKVQLGTQANWSLDNTRDATSDAKAAAGEESTTTNRLNPLRLDGNKIQELRERMKILQRLEEKPDAPVTHEGTKDNGSQQEQQPHILTHIKEEPTEKKYEEEETEFDSRRRDEDPPLKKRRRLEESTSTEYNCAPYDQLTTGVRVIEIKPQPDIKQEPGEEPIVRTLQKRTDFKGINKGRESIANQEPQEEPGSRIKQEPQGEPIVIGRHIKASSTLTARIEYTATGSKTNSKTKTDDEKSSGLEMAAVQSLPEEARLVQTLRPQSLTSRLTGVAVLSGSLFVVSEMNSVVDVYDSTTLTFRGKVSVVDLTNPQFLTACSLNGCLYILNRAMLSNAIYRLGLAPHWRHNKWLIGADFGALSATSTGSLLLSCFDLKVKEFSTNGQLIRQFQFGQKQSTPELRLFGAVQLPTTTTTETVKAAAAAAAAEEEEHQYVISYSHRSTGLHRVCTIDGNGRVVTPLFKYSGLCTSQHLIIGSQTGALFLADFGLGEVFQWNAQLKDCRVIRRKKDDGFRPLRICLDQNDRRLIIAEVALGNSALGTSRISVYDL